MRYLLIIAALFLHADSTAQSCPANIDFEQGDFTNWQCFKGATYTNNGRNIINLQPSNPVASRHKIISADTTGVIPLDEYGKFPKLCPYGGKYSVKLGNDDINAEAEGVSYTFIVPSTEDTFSFTYFYAVVFQDPQHALEEQPRFFVSAYETLTGNLINCASYNYVSTGGLPGFKKSQVGDGVLYKEWSPVSIQFVGLANKQVTLEFKTGDCTQGGHFGYAYLDVGGGCSNILATAPYCIETNSLLLNAPYGFKNYTWYNETYTQILGHDQNLTLSPPPVTSGKFWIDLEPYPGYGCRDTVYAIVTPLPVPDTPAAKSYYFLCQHENADHLEATPSINSDLLWYSDTTKPGSSEPIIPQTSKPGTFYYYVSQKILFGCESFKKKITVQVDPVPVMSIKIDNDTLCLRNNQFTCISTSTNLKEPTYTWNFGDGTTLSGNDTVQHSYTDYGSFFIQLKITNGAVCNNSKQTKVTVIPKPVAEFDYPPVICQNETVLALKDRSTVPRQLSSVTKWQWLIKGTKDSVQNPATFIPADAGDIPVALTVTTREGCVSDTVNKVLKVRYQPQALFAYDAPLCDNKIIHFTDQSLLSPTAVDESINTWQWKMDNVSVSTQNPAYSFAEGDHHASLTVKTNFGCSSLPFDSLIHVNPQPYAAVHVNDSCVLRKIIYTAQDLSGNVNDWHWDFGSGLKKGNATVAKYFYEEGDNTFTVMAKTAEGCTDTIYRPFMIFKNKAFAGYDTLAAKNQPVQLNAHGGTNNHYTWSPPIGLSDPHIENPVAIYDKEQRYRLDAITNEGCDAHSDILIKRYFGPDILIPTGFTPNRDGKNDILRAIPVGMKGLDYFAIYNRYGQRIFYTRDFTKGWDGNINGMPAQLSTYVVVAEATDYTGKKVVKKGTAVLIR